MWFCNKKNALSTIDAEVISLATFFQDLLSFKNIACKIINIKNLVISGDNEAYVKCISNDNNSGRMKHIDIKIKFVVIENNITIRYIPINIQITDLFVNAFHKAKLYELLFHRFFYI